MSLNTNRLAYFELSLQKMALIVVVLLLTSASVFAQEKVYTKLYKNIDFRAEGLNHNLSASQDSLILENKYLFHRVRFLNTTTEKIFRYSPRVKSAIVPLGDLPLGSYTVMFYQEDKIIVFQIERLLPFKVNPDVRPDLNGINSEDALAYSDLADSSSDTNIVTKGVRPEKPRKTRNDSKYYTLRDGGYFTYNLSISDRLIVQSRAEYRRTHLRPNGKPYTD